jgi:hypothetical protein
METIHELFHPCCETENMLPNSFRKTQALIKNAKADFAEIPRKNRSTLNRKLFVDFLRLHTLSFYPSCTTYIH